MSQQKRRAAGPPKPPRAPRRAPARGRNWWPIIGVAAAAVLVVGGLIWFSQSQSQSQTPAVSTSVPRDRNVLGQPNAPVTVEEWGDFQ